MPPPGRRAQVLSLAGPADLLDAASGADLLHVAAHGTHDVENPLFSSLELTDGLVFGHDLTRLSTAPRHVVLSACDLGLATARPGAESLGMTAALLHGGTGSVVAGVARVADGIACEVAVAYHRQLAGGPASVVLAGRGPGRNGRRRQRRGVRSADLLRLRLVGGRLPPTRRSVATGTMAACPPVRSPPASSRRTSWSPS